MATTFDTRQFVIECRVASAVNDAVTATRAVVREAVRALAAGALALPPLDSVHALHAGDLLLGRDRTLFEDESVTVAVVETEPGHLQPPHDHSMCAVIGVFEGGERNRFYRRSDGRARLATHRIIRPELGIGRREGEVERKGFEGRKNRVRYKTLVCNIYSCNTRCTVMYIVQNWSGGQTPAQVEELLIVL